MDTSKVIDINKSEVNIYPQNSSYDPITNTTTVIYGSKEPSINTNLTPEQKEFAKDFEAAVAEAKAVKAAEAAEAKGGRKRNSKKRKSKKRKSKKRSYRRR